MSSLDAEDEEEDETIAEEPAAAGPAPVGGFAGGLCRRFAVGLGRGLAVGLGR